MIAHYTKEASFEIFNKISKRYDLTNRILSFGLDLYWRWNLSRKISKAPNLRLLDLATGTGDQLFSILSKRSNISDALGMDLSKEMVKIAMDKRLKKELSHRCRFQIADASNLPLDNASVDAITLSFGIRNMPNPSQVLQEAYRVLETAGSIYILEFSLPNRPWIQSIYLFYLRNILPKIGRLLTRDLNAYLYLNQTIESFPRGKDFEALMEEAHFSNIRHYPLSFGIATLYVGSKCL